MTRGANTITNPSGLNPYLDTLNFRTFPNHSVSGGSQVSETLIGLTPENVSQYAHLYELDELDTSVEDWCNNVLVEYDGACPASVEVDFDFSYSNASTTGQNVDDVKSRGVFSDILSPKTSTFEVAWMDIDSLIWDNNNGRYDVITADETQKLSATLTYDDDTFDSLIFVGVIDTNRYPVNDLMLVDRMEWERFDTTYNLYSNKSITLDTTFIYDQVKVPDDSPMFRINGDCNQNLIYDDKEITLADIPGLIEGAHEGVGLGIKFLKHIERCKSLLHMIDITEDDLKKSYSQVRKELKNYSKDLLKKDEIVVLNKIDLLDDKEVKKIKDNFLKKYKVKLITLSTLNKKSVSSIKSKIIKYVS